MSLRRPRWWRDCLAADWRAKQLGKLNRNWTAPGGKYYPLPEVYKKQYFERVTYEETPVHYELTPGRWEKDPETGEYRHVENRPIPVIYPEESQFGLWGGEGVIKGYVRKQDRLRIWSEPKMWWPKLQREVFYSEILDKYYLITCTGRTLNLVDDAYGFDHYILKTHEVDLKSRLGMKMKKMMLVKLLELEEFINSDEARKSPDLEKLARIYNRYKQYMKTSEEIEWMGLTPHQAIIKYVKEQEENERNSRRPWKEMFKAQLLAELEGDEGKQTDGSLLSKVRSLGGAVLQRGER